ncbi:MAG: universal stress protein [Actinomycetota bacterium]
MAVTVVGYDGSDCAEAALETAIDLSRDLGDELLITFGYEPGGRTGEEHAAHREAVKQFGERMTQRGLKRAEDAGVKANVALVPERAVDALVTMGAEHDARAIVVGTYGENPVKGAILGSTPYKLMQVAERPVLVVPVE